MSVEIDLKGLRERLPYGYAATLQQRIQRKYKKKYAKSSISRGLTAKFANAMIIKEALILIEENDKEIKELIVKIKQLREE